MVFTKPNNDLKPFQPYRWLGALKPLEKMQQSERILSVQVFTFLLHPTKILCKERIEVSIPQYGTNTPFGCPYD